VFELTPLRGVFQFELWDSPHLRERAAGLSGGLKLL
jgi:hypothetical protein